MLLLRNLLWIVLLPGVIAGYVPWRFYGLAHARPNFTNPIDLIALAVIAAGVGLLAACVWEFATPTMLGARARVGSTPTTRTLS